MPWHCVDCGRNDGLKETYCSFCFQDLVDDCNLYRQRIKLGYTSEEFYYIKNDKTMSLTPQEQLFADLFNHEKILVKDMSNLELRAHREKLASIAFEARARLSGADEEESERKKKANKGPGGFQRNLNVDENSSAAINGIKDRQKRLTKKEKIEQGLAKLYESSGMSQADAAKEAGRKMSNGNIHASLANKTTEEIKATEPVVKDNKPFFNPFAK